MKFQRFLILVFAAALTAGTCAASTVQMYVSGTGNQSLSLSIDGVTIGSYSGTNPVGAVINTTVNETTGWHNIAIDYDSISGTNYLALNLNGLGAPPLSAFGSYDAGGNTINGLQGNYFIGGVLQFTKYGEGPLYDGAVGSTEYYDGTQGLWAGVYTTTSNFEEQMTGYMYFGSGTGLLSDIPGQQGGAAPEPAGWWMVVAALPLMLFSKLRLRRAKARDSHARS